MYVVETHSVDETHRLGRRLAQALAPGDVVALVGDLGAGKTHFVQGVVAGLDVPAEAAHSPTFVLIQEYDGRLPICHIDAYRLRDVDEFVELGADEVLGSEAVCLIEWADRVEEVLPRDRLTISIEATGENIRRFRFSGSGPRSEAIVQAMRSEASEFGC